jgi:hypothetical protein
MDFDVYVARNRLTGGFMAENESLGKLKKHVMAKAEPGKNVAIYARTTLGGEKEVCRITVPICSEEKPTVPTKAKAEKLVKPVKPEPEPFQPIVMGKWTITGLDVVKGFKIDPPKPHPVTGKPMTYMRFPVPIVKIRIRGNDWPAGMEFIISRSKGGFAVFYPDGDRSATMGPSLTTNKLEERFGKPVSDAIFDLFAMALAVE